jgi:hypothetical protein
MESLPKEIGCYRHMHIMNRYKYVLQIKLPNSLYTASSLLRHAFFYITNTRVSQMKTVKLR